MPTRTCPPGHARNYPPGQIVLNPPSAAGSQLNPHGVSLRQSQPAGSQSSGSGSHWYSSGKPLTSDSCTTQNCEPGSQKRNPHWNSPSGGSQSTSSPTSTPTACASHSLGYTFPSHPHTGKKMSSQPCGFGLHSPGFGSSAHWLTGESHHWSSAHPPAHPDPPPPVVADVGPPDVAVASVVPVVPVVLVLVAAVVAADPPPVGSSVVPALVVPALTPSVVVPLEVDPAVVSSPFSPQAAATTNKLKQSVLIPR
jgi:hypothetical protein